LLWNNYRTHKLTKAKDTDLPQLVLSASEIPQKRKRHKSRVGRETKRRQTLSDFVEPSQARAFTQGYISGKEVQDQEELYSNKWNDSLWITGHWVQRGTWPKAYQEYNSAMSYPLARKKSTPSLLRKTSIPSITTPSDQKPRETKSAPYLDVRYETSLAIKGSFLGRPPVGVTDGCKITCHNLLTNEQHIPPHSLFRNDLFEQTLDKVRNRNEARVIQDISRLIVPSAETLATDGVEHLDILIENVNEAWNNAIPFVGSRPQPDYCVGFRSSAFTKNQLKKLEPLVGGLDYTSFFMATYQTYFPFLTCEVKCGAVALDIADRQNAHSMTLAVRGIVELFRAVRREKELHRDILAFSVSHDHATVRMYGHYALIEGDRTTFYRHTIRKYDFTEEEGKERWTAYRFIRNVYDLWMPSHLERICSAIEDLPIDLNFGLSQLSNSQSQKSEISTSQRQSESSLTAFGNNQQGVVLYQEITPATSITQEPEPASKKPRRGRER